MQDKNLETSLQWYGFGPEDALHNIAKGKTGKIVSNQNKTNIHPGWPIDPEEVI